MAILGVVLIVLGVGFMVLGFAAAAQSLRGVAKAQGVETLVGAVTDFVKALTAAPKWLALTIVGGILVAGGGYLLGVK